MAPGRFRTNAGGRPLRNGLLPDALCAAGYWIVRRSRYTLSFTRTRTS